jgi:hypothetical protein
MAAETRSINRRLEAAIKSLFPTNTTVGGAAVSMHIIDDNSVEKNDLFCVVACRELSLVTPGQTDYSAVIELAAISQIVEDKSATKCDALLKILMDFLIGTVTLSNLSVATGCTIQALHFMGNSGENDDTFNIKTTSIKIYLDKKEITT